MARQGSRSSSRSSGFGSRSSSFSGRTASPTPKSRTTTQQPTNTQQSSPPMQQSAGGMMGGIGSTIMTGMAFGGASEIGHQAVRSLMGGNSHNSQEVRPVETQQQEQNSHTKTNPCSEYNFKFVDCLKFNDNNISSCQVYFDDLKSCERSLI